LAALRIFLKKKNVGAGASETNPLAPPYKNSELTLGVFIWHGQTDRRRRKLPAGYVLFAMTR
jgi:hypothetical protein